MSAVHSDFLTVFAAVKVLSPTAYAFRDEPREFPAPAPPGPEPAPPAPDPVFLPALEGDLYSRLYTRPTRTGAPADFLAQRDHLSALSAANTGQGSWEPGWQVVGLEPDGRFAVRKDDITFWVGPDGLRVRSGQPAAGDYCRVRVAKEMRSLMPGFYCEESGTATRTTPGMPRPRWYGSTGTSPPGPPSRTSLRSPAD